ncbi:UNVERIFIED_CONTAM: Voltage-gated potassium channel subunit beta-1 [Gekko kuhli]
MQVSIACTEHNLKNRNGEDRLISKQNTSNPNAVNAARAKFRTVAIIARSLGTFTPQHHISLKESTAKQTGMKYRVWYVLES